MPAIAPGDFVPVTHDTYSDFANSMADLMDRELHRLLRLDDPAGAEVGLSFDDSNKDVRARRRLFVAIARGIVLYLRDHNDGISVSVATFGTVNPTINVAATVQSTAKP